MEQRDTEGSTTTAFPLYHPFADSLLQLLFKASQVGFTGIDNDPPYRTSFHNVSDSQPRVPPVISVRNRISSADQSVLITFFSELAAIGNETGYPVT